MYIFTSSSAESYEGLVKSMRVIKLDSVSLSDVQYVAVVVGCELAFEDGSFVRLLKVEEGDALQYVILVMTNVIK